MLPRLMFTREDLDLFPFRSRSVRIEVMNRKTRTTARRWILTGFLVFASCGLSSAQSGEEAFVAFMGDAGSGNRPQARVRDRLLDRSRNDLLDYVFTLGDNVYETATRTRSTKSTSSSMRGCSSRGSASIRPG